jgi:hypothetical protein
MNMLSGNKLVVAATSLSLLSGCLKKESQPASEPESRVQTSVPTLPTAPKVVADQRIVSFFLDEGIPATVKSAILNPGAHAALKAVLDSGNSGQPITYHRDAYPAEVGQDAVKVLQYLLNGARIPAQEKGRKLIEEMTERAKGEKSPYKEDTLEGIKYLREWFGNPPTEVLIDGDYGRKSHTLRAWITQTENSVTGGRFVHNKQDSGASDTGIGHRTLALLLKYSPGLDAALTNSYEVVELSHQAASAERR